MATVCSPALTRAYARSLLLSISILVSAAGCGQDAGTGGRPYGPGACGRPGCCPCEAHSWLLWSMAAQTVDAVDDDERQNLKGRSTASRGGRRQSIQRRLVHVNSTGFPLERFPVEGPPAAVRPRPDAAQGWCADGACPLLSAPR